MALQRRGRCSGAADREAQRPAVRNLYAAARPRPARHDGQRLDPARSALSAARRRLCSWGPTSKLSRKTRRRYPQLNFSDRKLTMGGAGLATTIDDYMRFARMLLSHGTLDGVRILKPSTVRLMTTDQLDPKMTERWWLPDQGQWRVRLRFLRPHRPAQGCGGKPRHGRRILLGRRLVDPVLGRSRQRHGGGLPGPDGSLRRHAPPRHPRGGLRTRLSRPEGRLSGRPLKSGAPETHIAGEDGGSSDDRRAPGARPCRLAP